MIFKTVASNPMMMLIWLETLCVTVWEQPWELEIRGWLDFREFLALSSLLIGWNSGWEFRNAFRGRIRQISLSNQYLLFRFSVCMSSPFKEPETAFNFAASSNTSQKFFDKVFGLPIGSRSKIAKGIVVSMLEYSRIAIFLKEENICYFHNSTYNEVAETYQMW